MIIYQFDGSMTGLLSCIFRAFQFKEFEVQLALEHQAQDSLFAESIVVSNHEQQALRVWTGLSQKLSPEGLKRFYYTFLSEQLIAFQHLFNFAVYVFQSSFSVEKNYGHADVLAVSQWTKQVGREKHRMEAFVRFKKTQEGLFISLVRPDFNVLPLIERHFKARYQDQKWLIYDEKRHYGIFYDLNQTHQIELDASYIDRNINNGFSQEFCLALDENEALYDQLWKDYFKSVNIDARNNIKLHIQYVPKRYWRYMNEKIL
ncbi:TIGR03915 family putative DNA repair protein [Acinetobacter sp. S40]|uniref:TIGR03915 family putative DNA repair protein n=1 Tax=Acinetobacter sp. S40 TaxID=2767434 RepID=UPI00190CD92F|nr:TIGR03915 family putative DNA repair protein [Acinetobacter sp. S40]MBJ9985269.1 TIGR03915 family putative DNA repair protein [Acinetobacter sp. S40]